MVEDVREILHDSAPRPEHRPDFEQVWARGRRQRRAAWLAGTAGAVAVLAVAGAVLAEVAAPPPGSVEVADLPDRQERSGRGQDFGEAETAAGVPYGGRLQVTAASQGDDDAADDREEVCLTLRTGRPGEGSSSRGCVPLDEYLRRNRPLTVNGQQPALTAVAVWTPRVIDHAIWELPEENLPIEVSEAPDAPGSVFVAAIDRDPGAATLIQLYDADGARVDTITIEDAYDASTDDQVLFELGDASVWESNPTSSVEDAAEGFASEALGWVDADIEPDGAAPGPSWVRIGGPEQQQVEVLFSPDSAEEGVWRVLEVGDGPGRVLEDLTLELEAVPADADHATLWVGSYGQTRQLVVDGQELTGGRVDLDQAGLSRDQLVASLIIYRDQAGDIVEVHGGRHPTDALP